MRIRYDEKVDALYLRLDDSKVVESEEVKPGIVLDFNGKKLTSFTRPDSAGGPAR